MQSVKFSNFPSRDSENHRSHHSGSNSNFSFDEEKPSNHRRQLSDSLLGLIENYLQEATSMSSELSQPYSLFKQAKNQFLKLAEREADREIQEKKFEIEQVRENLQVLLSELVSHKKAISEGLPQGGVKEQFFAVYKERIQKTAALLEDEKNRSLNISLDLEIVPKTVLKETKDKIKTLQNEIDKFKMQTLEFTPDTARLRPTEGDSEVIEEVDELICQRIKDLVNLLGTFSHSHPHSLSLISNSPDFDPHLPLKCFDSFRTLETKILQILKSFSQSYNFEDNTEQISELKSVLQSLTQENLLLKQRVNASKAHENEINLMLRNKELSFEEKISDIREQTQTEMIKMQDALGQVYEMNSLRNRISQLETELQAAEAAVSKGAPLNFERELENVRKIYNDKYEELFRLTSEQITDLEHKLKESQLNKQSFAEEIRASVRKEEYKIRDQEIARLTQLHYREMRLVQSEFEEFLSKSKVEIAKLGRLVEKAIKNSDYKLLSSIQEDIQTFHDKVQNQAARIKDDSFSIAFDDDRQCKRCGQNENKSQFCHFHPYLSGSDAKEMLYTPEWHKCRESRHTADSTPCTKLNKHFYGPENTNFVKIFEKFSSDTVSFAGSKAKERPDSPSRTLHEALFSTDKKFSQEASATDLLDSYIAKYS